MRSKPSVTPDGREISDHDPVALACQMSAFRRARNAMFDSLVLADPEWDILLHLFAESGFGRRVSMSHLCAAARVPTTTAVRYINAMIEQGVLAKSRDRSDARRVLIELTDEAQRKMRLLLS